MDNADEDLSKIIKDLKSTEPVNIGNLNTINLEKLVKIEQQLNKNPQSPPFLTPKGINCTDQDIADSLRKILINRIMQHLQPGKQLPLISGDNYLETIAKLVDYLNPQAPPQPTVATGGAVTAETPEAASNPPTQIDKTPGASDGKQRPPSR